MGVLVRLGRDYVGTGPLAHSVRRHPPTSFGTRTDTNLVLASAAPSIKIRSMLRTQLYADPHGLFVHDVVLESCRRFPEKTAIFDTSCNRRLSYGEYGEMVERLARGFVAAGLKLGEVIAIFLPNCWEFCAAYHAATLAGAVPTLLNPSYREREARS